MKMMLGALPLRLIEHLAPPAGAHPDEHLDELRGRNVEERHPRLAGKRPRQQRLASPGRPRHQHAVRDLCTELGEAARVAQEVDEFRHLALGVVLSGHVGEGHALVPLLLLLGGAGQEAVYVAAAESAGDATAHPFPEEQVDGDDQDPRQQPVKNLR